MTVNQKNAWLSFIAVIKGFLGNRKEANYKDLVETMLDNFKKLGCSMSVKLHFLYSHLDFFAANLGDVSEEQGKKFHQDMKEIERRYQGRWNSAMLGDYCWSLKRDQKNASHKRHCNSCSFDEKRKDFINHCKSNLTGRGIIHLAFTGRGIIHLAFTGRGIIHLAFTGRGIIYLAFTGRGIIHLAFTGRGIIHFAFTGRGIIHLAFTGQGVTNFALEIRILRGTIYRTSNWYISGKKSL
ncbi:hypothetical protein ALC60_12354 [Trachymyrmex zeteki]|uniref:Uncharacterized protein n=1 Tax=Mycetomoellerius zeteki TaxID=64791 RepID=A0A151WL34_9HYME|nr:hypothetical protein ALC60_12354 [Trachymyrmex zeteki]